MVYDEFLEKFLQSGIELQIWRKVVLGARNNKFRRVATWNNNRGAEGGGREIWFNLPLHTSAWKRRWKSRRSFSCYVSRLKMKDIKKKKIVRVSLLLITLFTMLNTICLGYTQGKKFEGINQREERRRSETKRWLVKPSFHQSGKCFCNVTQSSRRAICGYPGHQITETQSWNLSWVREMSS